MRMKKAMMTRLKVTTLKLRRKMRMNHLTLLPRPRRLTNGTGTV
jgi:hypothetical protein